MPQVAPGIARFELRYNIPENQIENVFHVKSSVTPWSPSVMDATEAAFVSWFTTDMSPVLSDQLNLYEIVATDLTSLTGIRKTYPISPALIGGSTAEYLPANVTFALKASIGRRGRGNNGRIFWPTIVATQVTNNELDLAAANGFVTVMGQLITALHGVAGVDGLCVPHFIVGGVRPPTVTADLTQNYAYTDLLLDSQRDRLPGHKKHKRKPIA